MNYLQAFERSVRVYGDDTAIVAADGETYTYTELDRRSTNLANALHERIPGERCAVLALNGLASIESMIAGQKRGEATVQLPFRGKAGELATMMEKADSAAILFDDEKAETALSAIDRLDVDVAIHAGEKDLDRDDVESYEEILADADDELAPGLPDGNEYGVFYTSGTTSAPKAVLFDQEQMWHGSTQVIMELSITEVDTAVVCTPWYHMVTTDAWILPHLQAGATLVVHPDFDPDGVLQSIEEHEATGLLAVPTQLDSINDVQADAGYDTESLSYIRTGGSIVTQDLIRRSSDLLTENVFNTYGLTEGGPNLTFAHPSVQDEHTGTLGKESYMWNIRVVEAAPADEMPDPEAEVDPGGRGELLAKGPGMSDGYLDNPEAEEKLFVDGWLRTRDVAEVDEDGYIYITDRVDNMIVSGGENVYPEEVQNTLAEHPAVEESLVFGLPDDHWGEIVSAVVVTDDDVTADDLDEFCKNSEYLADFKRPRRWAFQSDPLPRSDTGTVMRGEVIDRHFDR